MLQVFHLHSPLTYVNVCYHILQAQVMLLVQKEAKQLLNVFSFLSPSNNKQFNYFITTKRAASNYAALICYYLFKNSNTFICSASVTIPPK